jgi:hypothetical protein
MVDTGKRRVVSASAEETEMAPGDNGTAGSALTLYNAEITYNIGVSTSNEPSLSRYENKDQTEIYGLSEQYTSGIKVPTITIRGAFDMTTNSGRKTFAALAKMAKTKGIKTISGTDKTLMWLNYLNYYDNYYCNQSKTAGTESVTGTAITSDAILGQIYVRITDFTVPASAESNLAPYTLTMVETG